MHYAPGAPFHPYWIRERDLQLSGPLINRQLYAGFRQGLIIGILYFLMKADECNPLYLGMGIHAFPDGSDGDMSRPDQREMIDAG